MDRDTQYSSSFRASISALVTFQNTTYTPKNSHTLRCPRWESQGTLTIYHGRHGTTAHPRRQQAGTARVGQWPAAAESHKSRAMRHRVRIVYFLPFFAMADFNRAPFCQIYDSVFRKHIQNHANQRLPADRLAVDLPMSRVKFNVNTDYAYLENFRILSSTRASVPPIMYGILIIFQARFVDMGSKGQFRWSSSSNARCRTIWNFYNGQRGIGINTSLAVTTMQ